MTANPDWAALRKDFPILDQQVHGKPLIYFDNAATSQKPRAVIDALVHYYEHDNANVHRGIHELSNRATAGYEAARARAAKFINARSADEIIFTRGTTEGINLVASSWGAKNLKSGDVILLTEMEHHSNLVPWQLLAQRTGAKIAYVPVTGDEGLLDLSKLDSLLTKQVKLFAMVHISNSTGHGESRGRTLRPRAQARHHHARGRRAKRRALPGGRAGHRLRFLCVLRPQDLRADRHRRVVGPAGIARRHAAVSGRRRNDFDRGLPQDRIQARAAPVRGRHAGHFRPDRPARRDGLSRRHRPRKHLAARPGTGELRLRKTGRAERTSACSARKPAAPAW